MYKTIQYKSLCDFFERGTKEQYTSDEIIEAVCPGGAGKSTVLAFNAMELKDCILCV